MYRKKEPWLFYQLDASHTAYLTASSNFDEIFVPCKLCVHYIKAIHSKNTYLGTYFECCWHNNIISTQLCRILWWKQMIFAWVCLKQFDDHFWGEIGSVQFYGVCVVVRWNLPRHNKATHTKYSVSGLESSTAPRIWCDKIIDWQIQHCYRKQHFQRRKCSNYFGNTVFAFFISSIFIDIFCIVTNNTLSYHTYYILYVLCRYIPM